MKVTTVKEIPNKDGTKTIITIEENLNDADDTQLRRHLALVGFYEQDNLFKKILRALMGKD